MGDKNPHGSLALDLLGFVPHQPFFDQALDAVRDVPGVRSASLTTQLPLSGGIDVYGVTLDEENAGPAYRYAVNADYLETMGIGLVRGRGLGRGQSR